MSTLLPTRTTRSAIPMGLAILALAMAFTGLPLVLAPVPDASACSHAMPHIYVSPSSGLEPGQVIAIEGDGFFHYEYVEPPDSDEPVDSCYGIQEIPATGLTISWSGAGGHAVLGVIDGPEFGVEVVVPDWAEPGWALVEVEGVGAEVHVGPYEPPVDPCEEDPGSCPCPAIYPPPPECDPCFHDPGSPNCGEPCLGPEGELLPHCQDPCFGPDGELLPECQDPCFGPDGELLPECQDPCLVEPGWPDCPDPCSGLDGQMLPECQDPCFGPDGQWLPECQDPCKVNPEDCPVACIAIYPAPPECPPCPVGDDDRDALVCVDPDPCSEAGTGCPEPKPIDATEPTEDAAEDDADPTDGRRGRRGRGPMPWPAQEPALPDAAADRAREMLDQIWCGFGPGGSCRPVAAPGPFGFVQMAIRVLLAGR